MKNKGSVRLGLEKYKWKKYPTPFVWDNPMPKGGAVLVTAGVYKLGTRAKLRQEGYGL